MTKLLDALRGYESKTRAAHVRDTTAAARRLHAAQKMFEQLKANATDCLRRALAAAAARNIVAHDRWMRVYSQYSAEIRARSPYIATQEYNNALYQEHSRWQYEASGRKLA